MNSSRLLLLTAGLFLADGAAAQFSNDPLWVAPGLSSSEVDTFLDFTTHPLLIGLTGHPRPIFACSVHKMPSDPPGQVTLSFTIRGLQGFGNPGFSGFMMAEWNPSSATPLVLKNYADDINEAFVDYNLNLEPITTGAGGVRTGGRHAIFDRFGSPPGLAYMGMYLASRADDRSDFGAAVPIGNVQATAGFGDPTLGYVDGQLKIFYAGQLANSNGVVVGGILMDDLLGAGTATPMAAGNPVLVAQPLASGDPADIYDHSPSLLHGADGDVEGLFVAEGDAPAGLGDIYFAADLNPDTPQVLTVESDSWLSSGGNAGGIAIFTQRNNAQAPRVVHGSWLSGDVVSPGGIANITVSVYSPPGQAHSYSRVSTGPWLTNPITLPNTHGSLAVAPFFRLGSGFIHDADQVKSYALFVPPVPALVGLDIPLQGWTRSFPGVLSWTNTAMLSIR